MILILKRESSATRQHKTLAQKTATTWQQEFRKRVCTVMTWWQELRVQKRHAMTTTWWQEFTRRSPTAHLVHLQESRKNRSTSQPQFCSENTPVTIEADQILLALQQLANNNNSAKFRNNVNRISKLPKSLTTTMPTFDGKCEKFELFEDLF